MTRYGVFKSSEGKTIVSLKPCPFCAGTAATARHDNYFWIECMKCSARGPMQGISGALTDHVIEDVTAEVVEMWNRRAAYETR